MSKQTNSIYLGDGVYASFDGHNICLRLGSHNSNEVVDSSPSITLSPEVLDALNVYAEKLNVGG